MASNIMSTSASKQLAQLSIAVVGCGGLGGFVIDNLCRSGATKLTIIDNDIFDISNINRQIFCNTDTVGKHKAYATATIVSANFDIDIVGIVDRLSQDNCSQLLDTADIVFDCVDNIESKLLLEQYCHANNKLLIHGGVDEYYGQCCITNDGNTIANLFAGDNIPHNNDYFAVATVSAVMVSLLYAHLEGRARYNCIVNIDLFNYSMQYIDN